MTIDDAHRSSADMVREAAADDAQREWNDWQEQRMLESEEAEAARWSHLMRRAAAERPPVWYSERPAIDDRCFATEGDLIEQARRDAARHGFPGGDAA